MSCIRVQFSRSKSTSHTSVRKTVVLRYSQYVSVLIAIENFVCRLEQGKTFPPELHLEHEYVLVEYDSWGIHQMG